MVLSRGYALAEMFHGGALVRWVIISKLVYTRPVYKHKYYLLSPLHGSVGDGFAVSRWRKYVGTFCLECVLLLFVRFAWLL